MNTLLARLKEPSTYRGLTLLGAVVGINIINIKDDNLLTISTQYGSFGTYEILILEKK